MWCSVRVHTGGNRAKPPQARKARRPTTADRTSVLCITSAEFGGSGGPSLTSERMAGNYWNTFAPGATHLSSPTSATKSAKSGLCLDSGQLYLLIQSAGECPYRRGTMLRSIPWDVCIGPVPDLDLCRDK